MASSHGKVRLHILEITWEGSILYIRVGRGGGVGFLGESDIALGWRACVVSSRPCKISIACVSI